jgi:hypothetical protein
MAEGPYTQYCCAAATPCCYYWDVLEAMHDFFAMTMKCDLIQSEVGISELLIE